MSKAKAEWSQIDWVKAQTKVTKLQNRIYAASKDVKVVEVIRLQKTLVSSYSARLLAVRKVTQENRGMSIAGVDGVKTVNNEKRMEMVENLRLDGKSSPLNKILSPKPGKAEKRPLGIPTMMDRAKQALAKLALEPEWEAKFEPNSYGFRPGRGCHDAIEAIELSIRRKGKYVLDADVKGCFDNIDHEALLNKMKTYPAMERQIRAWLKSGILEGEVFGRTDTGTPQGGVISPLLANIALHGLESYITQNFPMVKTRKGQPKGKMREIGEARVIRYADDFVILHEKEEVIRSAKLMTEEWMSGMGLKLNEQKTRITNTIHEVNGEKPGFDFLGFNIRTHEVGKHKCGTKANEEPLMIRTIVRPSDDSIAKFRRNIKNILEKGHSQKPEDLIKRINWYIRGWANYFRTGDSSHKTFRKLQNDLYQVYLGWGRKKFAQRGDGYIVKKIFHKSKYSKWNFGWKENKETHLAVTLYEFPYKKHIKVQGSRSPYDGDWNYWMGRRGNHPLCPKDIKSGLQRQEGKCYHCRSQFQVEDQIHIHHIDGNRKNNKTTNKVLLHLHCHDDIHRMRGQSVELPT